MILDANVCIWVGIKLEPHKEDPGKLPELLQKAEESENYDIIYDGVAFNFIGPRDLEQPDYGFGVEVFSHDWDYGVKEFDLAKVSAEIDHVMPIVKKALEEWGLPEPKLLLQTNCF